jgi:hypothetical protein
LTEASSLLENNFEPAGLEENQQATLAEEIDRSAQ